MNQFTSFELSKKLWENGCRLNTNWGVNKNCLFTLINYSQSFFGIHKDKNGNIIEEYPTYDIFWDICKKYKYDFFDPFSFKLLNAMKDIYLMLDRNDCVDDIEKYIWDNCLFNPKNKES